MITVVCSFFNLRTYETPLNHVLMLLSMFADHIISWKRALIVNNICVHSSTNIVRIVQTTYNQKSMFTQSRITKECGSPRIYGRICYCISVYTSSYTSLHCIVNDLHAVDQNSHVSSPLFVCRCMHGCRAFSSHNWANILLLSRDSHMRNEVNIPM